MMSECSYSWGVVLVFGISLCCLCLSINICYVAYCDMTNHICAIVLFASTLVIWNMSLTKKLKLT